MTRRIVGYEHPAPGDLLPVTVRFEVRADDPGSMPLTRSLRSAEAG